MPEEDLNQNLQPPVTSNSKVPTISELENLKEGISILKEGIGKIKELPPAARAKVIAEILGEKENKPHGFSRTSVAPYYAEKYALIVQRILDKHFIPQLETHK